MFRGGLGGFQGKVVFQGGLTVYATGICFGREVPTSGLNLGQSTHSLGTVNPISPNPFPDPREDLESRSPNLGPVLLRVLYRNPH